MKTNQIIVASLVGLTTCSSLVLASIHTYADNDTAVDEVEITVPVACTMTGTIDANHTATLTPGTYSGTSTDYANGIGKTTLTTFCNDNNGFSIYAIGFTGDTEGTNTLVGTNTGATIATKAYESTDTTSNWSMKVTKVTDTSTTYNPNNMTITNSYDSWHAVPDDYTKVAEYKSTTEPATTDTTLGAKVETTYATYVATNQPADTYTGKVKYVMVHPYDHATPIVPPSPISQCPTPVPNVTYMQDVTNANLATVLQSMDMNAQYYLRDKRDETPYCVSKLDDGSETGTIWMTQNLRIQGTISAELSNFEGSDFNVSEYDLKTDASSSDGACYGTYESITGGYYNACSHLPEPSEIPSSYTAEQIGAWYNYVAISAGTIINRSNAPASEDICPANWRLPNNDSSKPAGSIDSLTGSTTLTDVFSPSIGGHYNGIGSIDSSDRGCWWSSTHYYGPDGRGALTVGNDALWLDSYPRYDGLYARCVSDPN